MTRRLTTWLVALALGAPAAALAQNAYLVRDIGLGPVFDQPSPTGTIAVGARLYFAGSDFANGQELWTSDGTPDGTRIVIDGASNPNSFAAMNDRAYFVASGEIWRSDATVLGTFPISNLAPGFPSSPTPAGSTLFFAADDPASGRELWGTDGTLAGTALVRDIVPGVVGSDPQELVAAGAFVFFRAFNPTTTEFELWRSDGTPTGTISLGTGPGAPEFPRRLTAVGATVFFEASDPVHGSELWKSDGTAAGTVLVINIAAGMTDSFPSQLTDVAGTLYFAASEPATGTELWKSDGTAAGTILVADAAPGSASTFPADLVAVGSRVFYNAEIPSASRPLWVSDGTAAGTGVVANVLPAPSSRGVALGGSLFFVGFTPAEGFELWRSDGTGTGTRIVADLVPGDFSSFPTDFAVAGSSLYFTAVTTDNRRPLWRTDGTAGGTVEVGPVPPVSGGGSIEFVAPAGDGLAFRVNSSPSLWLSRGTEGTTVQITAPPGPCPPTIAGRPLFVTGSDAAFGLELWATTGTPENTCRVTDLAPGPASASIPVVVEVGERVFFASAGRLWVVSAAATTPFVAATGLDPRRGVAFKDQLFFANLFGELWKSDGTTAGTVPVSSVRARSFMATPSLLYFVADTGTGQELWKTDGTPVGTSQVTEICPGPCDAFDLLLAEDVADHAAIGDVLYFVAEDGTHGREVWRTDGTAAGTTMLVDLSPSALSVQGCLTELDGVLLFCGDDGINGREVWRSDGTAVGTVRITDLAPGDGTGVLFGSFRRAGGRVVFGGYTPALGIEPWATDGTPGGTALLHDIYQGPGSSAQFLSTIEAGPRVYVTADDGLHGRELWAAEVAPALSVGDATVREGNGGSATVLVEVRATGAPSAPAIVAYATANGTAQAGADYTPASGTITFPPGGPTVRTIAIAVAGDLAQEADETFAVQLSAPSGVDIGDGRATVMILDDDGPRVDVGDASVVEGDVGDVQAQFQVRLATADGAATTTATGVSFATSDGTAAAGPDYASTTGTVTFPPGSPSGSAQSVTVAVHGDTVAESHEVFRIRLQPLTAATATSAATCRIADDDGAPDAAPLGLAHGSVRTADLAAQAGPVADTDWYALVSDDPSSYEVVVDGVSGDVQPLSVELLTAGGVTPAATGTSVGTGGARSLRFNTASAPQRIRVRSGGCGTACGPDDTYRIRAYDTSYAIPRVVASDVLSSAVILQNRTTAFIFASARFWRADGTLLTEVARILSPRGTEVVPVPSNTSGSATVTHDGGYGALAGKAVTVDVVTGASYDTPMEPRRR
jgi:ELWxxDGT repeat protein